MQTSKFLIKLSFTLSLSLNLVGCLPSPKTEQPLGTLSATFSAEAMPDKSKAVDGPVAGAFNLPDTKIFNLQACIKDSAYGRIIPGHTFLIEELNETFTTDKSGCLTWPENIKYNYLAESQYVRIDRHIVGTGLNRGKQKVSFAVNPWSHGETLAPVLNPNQGNDIPRLVENAEDGKAALMGRNQDTTEVKSRSLWADDGRFFVTEQQMSSAGVTLLVEMRPNISIQMTKMNGEIYLRPLTSGKFKAQLSLIHLYQHENKEVRRLMAISESQDVIMSNASISIKAPMTLTALPTRGQIYVGLQLIPVAGPEGLRTFEGIYLMGDFDNFKGIFLTKLTSTAAQSGSFKISEYINAKFEDLTYNEKNTNIQDDVYQKPKIEVSQLDFRLVRVGKETTSMREIIYNVRACVRSGIDQKAARAHTFKVTKFKENNSSTSSKTVEVKTDNNSCINWDESLTFNYFECNRFMKGSVRIENADYGMNESLDIIVNPWDASSSFARDLRYVDLTEKVILTCSNESRPKTQLYLDNYAYSTLSYDYKVDNNLTLSVHKKIQFKMEAKMLIYSSLTGGRSAVERLRDGVYLLRLAIVQNPDYDQKNSFVSSANKFVNVINGMINTDITFITSDLKALGNRNQLLVEIHPVDESKLVTQNGNFLLRKAGTFESVVDKESFLENPTFMGPITINLDEASRPLRLVDAEAINTFLKTGAGTLKTAGKNLIVSAQEIGVRAQQAITQKLKSQSDKNYIAKVNNLALVNLASADNQLPLIKALTKTTKLPAAQQITKAELWNALRDGKMNTTLTHKLCAFWAKDFAGSIQANKGGAFSPKSDTSFGSQCIFNATKFPDKFFIVNKELLIKEVGQVEYKKGLNHGVTVGTSFSLSKSFSDSFSKTFSVSGKLGVGGKAMDLVSVGVDSGYSLAWSKTNSQNSANSVSINANTTLNVQQSVFEIQAKQSEQCLIVRLNPTLFMTDDGGFFTRKTSFLNALNPKLSDTEKAQFVTRGLMICEGKINKTPRTVTENFYLLSQETSSTQMQDSGDAKNRKFFIALRSTKDMNRFMIATKSESDMPGTASHSDQTQTETTDMLEKIFKSPIIATPGVFHM